MNITVNIPHNDTLLIILMNKGYDILNPESAISIMNKEYVIEINTDDKTYSIVSAKEYPVAITNEDYVQNILNLEESFEEITNKIKNNPVEYMAGSIKNILNMHTESTNNPLDNVKPGDILRVEYKNTIMLGILLTNSTAILFNSTDIKYISNFTLDSPYKIISIRRPSDKHYRLDDFMNMELIWDRGPIKVEKTIAEIEKELGLEAGSLSII